MLTISKLFTILFLLCLLKLQNKSVGSSFKRVSKYILFLAKLKEIGRTFLEGVKTGRSKRLLPLVVTREENSFSYCEIWNNLTPLLLFIRPLTSKHSRVWSSLINFLYRFRDLPKESWKV